MRPLHVGGKIIESEARMITHASEPSASCVQYINTVCQKYESILFSTAERKSRRRILASLDTCRARVTRFLRGSFSRS